MTSSIIDSLPPLPSKAEEAGKKINGKRVRVPARVALGDITPNNVGTLKKLNLVLFPINYSDKFYTEVLDYKVEPYSKLVFYQDLAVGNIVSRIEPLSAVPSTSDTTATITITTTTSTTTSSSTASAAEGERTRAKLYIMTLGVLSPYRRQGLATKLLESVLTSARESHRPVPELPSELKAQTDSTTSSNKPSQSKKSKTDSATKKEEDEDEIKKKKKKVDNLRKEWERKRERQVIDSVYVHVWKGNEQGKTFWERNGFQVEGEIKDYYRKIEPRDAWILGRKIEPVAE